MNYQEILNIVAPCGLNCCKCFAYSRGKIKNHALELKKNLGNFDIYAKRFSRFLSEFKKYPDFKQMLQYLTQGDCNGCRNGTCKYPGCGVVQCYISKGVDFCFQCQEFPCDKTNFDPHLKKRWITMNKRMKKIGVEKYYAETKNLSRYI